MSGRAANVPFTRFGKSFGRENPEDILAGEFLLCQGLRFAIDVKHPFRALRGAIMELSTTPDIDVGHLPQTPTPLRTPPNASSPQHHRLGAAEHRAREILRFSPLITDAYFHYTPSQIMLAALSLADRGLAETLITQTFHYVAPPPNSSGAGTPASSGADATPAPPKRGHPRANPAEDKAQIIGSHLRDRVLGAIEACRDLLARELPERREHWTNVRSPPPHPFFYSTNTHPQNRKQSSKPKSPRSARSSTSAATRTGGT